MAGGVPRVEDLAVLHHHLRVQREPSAAGLLRITRLENELSKEKKDWDGNNCLFLHLRSTQGAIDIV